MSDFIPAWSVTIALFSSSLIALGLWLLYTVIRLAVRKALRQHQDWLDARGQPVDVDADV